MLFVFLFLTFHSVEQSLGLLAIYDKHVYALNSVFIKIITSLLYTLTKLKSIQYVGGIESQVL